MTVLLVGTFYSLDCLRGTQEPRILTKIRRFSKLILVLASLSFIAMLIYFGFCVPLPMVGLSELTHLIISF